jgi:hypothetical protein
MFVLDHIVHIKFSLENQYESIYVIQHEFPFHINLIMVLEYQQVAKNNNGYINQQCKPTQLEKQISFETIK